MKQTLKSFIDWINRINARNINEQKRKENGLEHK